MQVPTHFYAAPDVAGQRPGAEGGAAAAPPRAGMERMTSADEARASMQRARSAEATLSGMSLGAGAADAALARWCDPAAEGRDQGRMSG